MIAKKMEKTKTSQSNENGEGQLNPELDRSIERASAMLSITSSLIIIGSVFSFYGFARRINFDSPHPLNAIFQGPPLQPWLSLSYFAYIAAVVVMFFTVKEVAHIRALRKGQRARKSAPTTKPVSPFLRGAATLLDLRGASANPYRGIDPKVADSKAIESDWAHVGAAIEGAISKYRDSLPKDPTSQVMNGRS